MHSNKPQNPSEQLALFQSNADLVSQLLAQPKVDLHRHLTGSISAEVAVQVAAKHNILLPSYLVRELHDLLFPTQTVQTHAEYFTPWEVLNRLFVSLESVRDVVTYVIRDAARDNVAYLELRLGPRGFLGDSDYSFEDFIKCVSDAGQVAEERFKVSTRFILGLPRHVFARVPADTRKRMLARMIYVIREYPKSFVGVDLNGDELAASSSLFQSYFELAHESGLGITVHAGELSQDPHDIEFAVQKLGATRLGHGLAAARSTDTLMLLHRRQTVLELCPTSNEMLNLIDSPAGLPIQALQDYGIPFVICTDNPARCRTTMTEELYRVATAFSLSIKDLRAILEATVDCSFADNTVKEQVRRRLGGTQSRPVRPHC